MDDIEKKFGTRLKELRKKNCLSQSEFAEILEVDEKYVSRLETATSTPSFAMIVKICNALNIEPYNLFIFNHMKSKAYLIKLIINKLNKTDEKNVQLIYKIIESVID